MRVFMRAVWFDNTTQAFIKKEKNTSCPLEPSISKTRGKEVSLSVYIILRVCCLTSSFAEKTPYGSKLKLHIRASLRKILAVNCN